MVLFDVIDVLGDRKKKEKGLHQCPEFEHYYTVSRFVFFVFIVLLKYDVLY